MKNDKKLFNSVAILLLIVMVALILVSGTYAKYTSTASGSDTATVAKWSFKVSGTEIAVNGSAPTVTFDLFNTINDTKDGAAETDVKANLIAPGTQGSFELKLKNDSEVTAQYAIDYKVEKSDTTLPILFSTNGTDWTNDLVDVAASDATKLAVGAAEKTITVQWKWEYETKAEDNTVTAGDGVDTALGIAAQTAAPTVKVTATVTATQVD